MKPNGRAGILAVVPYFVPRIGGGETHLYQLSALLSRWGHPFTILTLRLPGTPAVEQVGTATVRRFGDALSGWGRRTGYEQILDYVRSNRFPQTALYQYLCVGSEHRTVLMSRVLAAAGRAGLPRVVRIPSSGRVTELELRCPEAIDELRRSEAVVTLNPGISEELLRVGVSPRRLHRIPNGVDVGVFRPPAQAERTSARERFGCPEDTLVVLCPSRLAPKKRIPDLLRLWKEVEGAAQGRGRCELWVVGDDRLEAKRGWVSRELRSLIREIDLAAIRLFPGVVHAEMPDYYRAADAYVSLSAQEGMSNAMLEAMSSGLPIIAPSTAATTQLVQDGESGFLFTPGDLAAARDAILRCVDAGSAERGEMGRRNRARIVAAHRMEEVAAAFSQLFDSLVFA